MFRTLASPLRMAFGRFSAAPALIPLGLLLPVCAGFGRASADRLAVEIAAGLTTAVSPLSAAYTSSARASASDEPRDEDEILGELPGPREALPVEQQPPHASLATLASAPGDRRHARTAPRSSLPAAAVPLRGIRISSAQVLALAARRAIPHASPVKANARHPAGLLLRGVSSLGVGLEDGDVLTEAAGQRVSSVGAVIGIVLAARARQSAEISGRFYRAGVPFLVTVEQPYPKPPVPG